MERVQQRGKTGQNEAKKRLQKELMDLMMANEKGISAFPEGDNPVQVMMTLISGVIVRN